MNEYTQIHSYIHLILTFTIYSLNIRSVWEKEGRDMDDLKEYVVATRPWSFTAAIVPIIVTTSVLHANFLSIEFAQAIIMGISVQAAANLTNTYFDFINGVDNKDNATAGTGEKTLVEKKVSTHGLISLAVALYMLAILSISPLLMRCWPTLVTFVCGTLLSMFYTATPVGLKYIALGDITIFLCFGPLLMQCTSLVITGELKNSLYIYSIPIGLLTEGILHANNARDIKSDTLAGASTLATIIGFRNSYYLYVALLMGAYLSSIYIAFFYHFGCVLTILTIPLAMDLEMRFRQKNMTG